MLNELMNKLAQVLDDRELDFMVAKLAATPAPTPPPAASPPPVPPPAAPASGGPTTPPAKPSFLDRAGEKVDKALDWAGEKATRGLDWAGDKADRGLTAASDAASAYGGAISEGFDAVTELDHEALGKAINSGALGAGAAMTPEIIESRLKSPKSKDMFHGLMGYGLPAATVAGIMYAMFSEKKKKKGEEGAGHAMNKLQSLRGLDAYIHAYIQDNGGFDL